MVSRDIADRADVRIARLQELIHDDAVLDGQIAGRGELDVRNDADADDYEVGGKHLAVHGFNASHGAGLSQQVHDLRVEQQAHAHLFVLAREHMRTWFSTMRAPSADRPRRER